MNLECIRSIEYMTSVLAICLLLIGCAGSKDNSGDLIDANAPHDTTWRLVSFTSELGLHSEAAADPETTMQLISGTEYVGGTINCRGVYGYLIEQSSIRFPLLPAIGEACATPSSEEVEAFENQMMFIRDSFETEVVYSFDDGDLIIHDMNGGVIRFTSQ